MKIFFKKLIIIFSLILFTQVLITYTIPGSWITHRVIENIKAKNGYLFLSSFYPNQNITMAEVGDLGHHTKYQIERKNITWTTDKFGFRNLKYIKEPDYVFIGKSFVYGVALNQNETLSDIFNKKTTETVYNLAPSNFNQFLERIENKIISKPKSLVYFSIERNIPDFKKVQKNKTKSILNKLKLPSFLNLITPFDKVSKLMYQKFIVSRIRKSKGAGVNYNDDRMLFLSVKDVENNSKYARFIDHAKTLKSYSNRCDSLGIEFIFIPIPNKETVYYRRAGMKTQPTYLNLFYSELAKRKVKFINLLEVFDAKKDSILLYHLDDTHWNSNGTNLAVDELIKYTNSQQ